MKNHIENYVRKIKRQLILEHNFPEHPIRKGEPMGLPNNRSFKVTIDGRVDNVYITDGYIEFCNFETSASA